MATLYLRGNIWWVAWGRKPRHQKSTTFPLEKRLDAERLKRKIESDLRKQKAMDAQLLEPARPQDTFRAYRVGWIARRKADGVSTAKDDEVRLKHVPELDGLYMDEIRSRHIEAAITRLKREKVLSHRSIRHVAGVLSVLFRTAFADEVVPANLFPLRRGILPGVKDKNPAWRATAVYAREEVELLLSSSLVPPERRMLYALLLLTGCRVGEVSDRRWRDYDAGREPLGCLHVHSSFKTKGRVSKETKTGVVRQVPVHPVLAQALDAWRKGGAEELLGRPPRPDDLILPHATGVNLTASVAWKRLQQDLKALSLRPRRAHDTRRAFVSLARMDGAPTDVLKLITHGASGNIMDLYTTLPWPTLCAAVLHLKIRAVVFATSSLQSTSGGRQNDESYQYVKSA